VNTPAVARSRALVNRMRPRYRRDVSQRPTITRASY
jgi:hypothetical protein